MNKEQIEEKAREEYKQGAPICAFMAGAEWMESQLEPKWIEIKSKEDLPTNEGKYFVYSKVDWHPFYRIDVFLGRLSNSLHHITGEPIFSHYCELIEPERPKDK